MAVARNAACGRARYMCSNSNLAIHIFIALLDSKSKQHFQCTHVVQLTQCHCLSLPMYIFCLTCLMLCLSRILQWVQFLLDSQVQCGQEQGLLNSPINKIHTDAMLSNDNALSHISTAAICCRRTRERVLGHQLWWSYKRSAQNWQEPERSALLLSVAGGLENEYEDSNLGEDGFGLPGSGSNTRDTSSGLQSTGASQSSTGAGAGAASRTGTGATSGSASALSAADRREQERDAAFQASTGGLPQGEACCM